MSTDGVKFHPHHQNRWTACWDRKLPTDSGGEAKYSGFVDADSGEIVEWLRCLGPCIRFWGVYVRCLLFWELTMNGKNKDLVQQGYTFSSPPDWLAEREGYFPWESVGRQKVWKRVEKLYWDSAFEVYDNPDANPFTEESHLALKLLNCWLFHWEQAGAETDGEFVAQSVADGRGFVGNGNLGGNPFFDLVFADALCAWQNRAAKRFMADCSIYLVNVVYKRFAPVRQGQRLVVEGLDWESAFLMYLTGFDSRNAEPPLKSYRGYSGLKHWLTRALCIFLSRSGFITTV